MAIILLVFLILFPFQAMAFHEKSSGRDNAIVVEGFILTNRDVNDLNKSGETLLNRKRDVRWVDILTLEIKDVSNERVVRDEGILKIISGPVTRKFETFNICFILIVAYAVLLSFAFFDRSWPFFGTATVVNFGLFLTTTWVIDTPIVVRFSIVGSILLSGCIFAWFRNTSTSKV